MKGGERPSFAKGCPLPELPEVETTVRGLEHVLKGRRIRRLEARRADLRRAFPKDLGQRLTGALVTSLARRAKYGLINTDRGDTMVFHLGMSGAWRIDPHELGKHDHLLIETDEGRRLHLRDPGASGRRPGADGLAEVARVQGAGSRTARGCIVGRGWRRFAGDGGA
jgi:formamidopyrimidine-DNA glycosylase